VIHIWIPGIKFKDIEIIVGAKLYAKALEVNFYKHDSPGAGG